MNIKQIQKLSDRTEQAVEVGDMKSLVNIYKLILQDRIDNPFENPEGSEWFWTLIPVDLWEGITNQANTP
jgi:hypothetical protein